MAVSKSIIGANSDRQGNLGTFEVVRTRSSHGGKWYVSLRNADHRWWHSPTVYTEREAATLCGLFYTLDDSALQAIVDDKLERAWRGR